MTALLNRVIFVKAFVVSYFEYFCVTPLCPANFAKKSADSYVQGAPIRLIAFLLRLLTFFVFVFNLWHFHYDVSFWEPFWVYLHFLATLYNYTNCYIKIIYREIICSITFGP